MFHGYFSYFENAQGFVAFSIPLSLDWRIFHHRFVECYISADGNFSYPTKISFLAFASSLLRWILGMWRMLWAKNSNVWETGFLRIHASYGVVSFSWEFGVWFSTYTAVLTTSAQRNFGKLEWRSIVLAVLLGDLWSSSLEKYPFFVQASHRLLIAEFSVVVCSRTFYRFIKLMSVMISLVL